MIVLDATVLVYSAGADHPLREPCAALMERVAEGGVEASTTAEVIQEFANVHARRRDRRTVARAARSFADLLAPLLAVERDDLDAGLDLFERRTSLGAFDAVLAALALRRGAEALVSADRAFADVPRLRHIDPASPALDDLLGAR